ncbi:ATP-dependent Clp protease adaptor protein-like protein [Salicola phage SCTP-2]|nr:ATP-dependent Clp protease adaptor protein-like protein [Salicola phage SCTP-2]
MSDQTSVKENIDLLVTSPKMYIAVIYNDNHTPFNLVINMLIKIFSKTEGDAKEITYNVHNNGYEVVLKSSYKYVKNKVDQAHEFMAQYGYPNFKIEIEEE